MLALGALACEAAFSLIALPLLASLGPAAVSTYACLFATLLLLVAGVVVNGEGAVPLPTGQEAAALGYLAVMVTAAGFTLWYASIERLGVDRAGLFAGVMPVSALSTAAAIGASELTWVRLLGAVAVGAGVMAGMAKTSSGTLGPPLAPRRIVVLRGAGRRASLLLVGEKKLLQQVGEVFLFFARQRREQAALVGEVLGGHVVDQLPPLRRQRDDNGATVGRIERSLDQPFALETLEPLGHGAGSAHESAVEARGGERIGSAASSETGEDVPVGPAEVVRGEELSQALIDEAGGAAEAGDHRDGRGIEVGALARPLGADPVDVVG